jgi:hypothetical protein
MKGNGHKKLISMKFKYVDKTNEKKAETSTDSLSEIQAQHSYDIAHRNHYMFAQNGLKKAAAEKAAGYAMNAA